MGLKYSLLMQYGLINFLALWALISSPVASELYSASCRELATARTD
jgi:hypothetical protein